MTQKSLPQQGHIQDALSPDAGPYSAGRWSEIWREIYTSSPDQGPIGETGDGTLEAKWNSASTIFVFAGQAMVSGRVFQSDAQMTFAIAPTVSNSRIDTIVVVQNESSSPVTHGIASGLALTFPTDLTDYDGSASIPPYSSRLAILPGVPAGSPDPSTLDQNPDLLHMIPIALVTITTSGATAVDDARVYTRSMAGGTIYVPEYHHSILAADFTKVVYSGRARIIPFATEIQIATSGYEGTVITQNSLPDPTFGVAKYASFFMATITDFDMRLPQGGSLRPLLEIDGFYPNPNWLRFSIYRGGYVDNAGVAQPMVTAAKGYDVHFLLFQLLDAPPTPDYGRLPEGGGS